MTTSFHRGSAEIYQFPARVRPAPGGHRDESESGENVATSNLNARRVTAVGGAWYHEAAIQEAEQAGRL